MYCFVVEIDVEVKMAQPRGWNVTSDELRTLAWYFRMLYIIPIPVNSIVSQE